MTIRSSIGISPSPIVEGVSRKVTKEPNALNGAFLKKFFQDLLFNLFFFHLSRFITLSFIACRFPSCFGFIIYCLINGLNLGLFLISCGNNSITFPSVLLALPGVIPYLALNSPGVSPVPIAPPWFNAGKPSTIRSLSRLSYSTANCLFDVLKSGFLITVLATRSNSSLVLSQRKANGIFTSVARSFITASASGPNCAIGLPCCLYICLNKRVNSLAVICLTLRSSFTLARKCRVNSTSIPSFANNLSANISSWSSSVWVNSLSTSFIRITVFIYIMQNEHLKIK